MTDLASTNHERSARRRSWLLIAAAALACTWAAPSAGQEAAAAVYVRTDSDETTVVTPRLRVSADLGEATDVEVVYTVDVWTSASIDIRTSASKAVTEQRDEIDVSVGHEFEDVRLRAGYFYSTEPDYHSHTVVAGAEADLAGKSTTLSASALARFDDVGRAGHPDFWRPAQTFGGRATLTQLLDPSTFVQGTYELNQQDGYLSSPYRFVAIGEDATCRGEPLYCAPETNPDARLRHALYVYGRRAFTPALSVGLGYRYYTDDWAVHSHTAEADAAFMASDDTLLSLSYRFYTQSAASHYRASYPELPEDGLFTRDKELSPLHDHGLSAGVEQRFQLDGDSALRALLAFGPTFYEYRDFAGLDHIVAFEATLGVVFEP